MKWNIVTDSSCDLPPAEHHESGYLLSSVPFIISVGNRDFVDDEHLDVQEMLTVMEHEQSICHTACPSPGAWLEQFEKAECTIAITISSQLSGSMNSAVAAREMALNVDPQKRIAVLDSCSTGPELALCVEEVEKLIKKGMDFDSVVAYAKNHLKKTRVLFALSSFDNLIKNGRMNKLTGIIAKALGMWGIGSGSDEGRINMEGKARGAKMALRMMLAHMSDHGFCGGKVAISHCDNMELAQALRQNIQEIWKNTDVKILPTRGLCSFYAERGGLIIGY